MCRGIDYIIVVTDQESDVGLFRRWNDLWQNVEGLLGIVAAFFVLAFVIMDISIVP